MTRQVLRIGASALLFMAATGTTVLTDCGMATGNDAKGGGTMVKQTAGRTALGDFAPKFAELNDDVLFGEVWNEESIDTRTRCIVTVVALMASGITDSSLGYHLQNSKNNGVTKEEIAAIITHAAMYVGWPKGWAVFRQAREIWGETESGKKDRE